MQFRRPLSNLIEVDEAGNEAATGTSSKGCLPGGFFRRQTRPVSFEADHPFLFFVLDLQTGPLLFQGRVLEPTEFPDDHIISSFWWS